MARITPTARLKLDSYLNRIVIELGPHETPLIRLEGRPMTATPMASRYSETTITTRHMTPEARAFVQSMLREFNAPDEKKD